MTLISQSFESPSSDPNFVFDPAQFSGADSTGREIVISCDPIINFGPGLDPNERKAFGSYIVILDTPQAPSFVDQAAQAYNLVNQLASTFGNKAQSLVSAIINNGSKIFATLNTGLQSAVVPFTTPDNLQTAVSNAVQKWLNVNVANISIPTGGNLSDALLSYAGLTVDNLKSMVIQALGASNVAAVETVAKWFDAPPGQPLTIQTIFANINATLSGDNIPGLNLSLSDLEKQLKDAVTSRLQTAATQAVGQLVAKFVPGLGGATALLQGFNYLLTNQDQIADIVGDFLNTVDDLVAGKSEDFATNLVKAINKSLPQLFQFAASQLGLGNLPGQVAAAINLVPNQVQQQIMKVLAAVAKSVKLPGGGAGNALYANQLAPVQPIKNPSGVVLYDLWTAKQGNSAVVKIAMDNNGNPALITSLSAMNFTSMQGKANVTKLMADAKSLANLLATVPPLSTKRGQAPPNKQLLGQIQMMVQMVQKDEAMLSANILNGDCGTLDGCFALGTELWTPDGFRRVESIFAGMSVFARDEYDPTGHVQVKRIEERFERLGRIMHLQVSGQTIRTTPQHRFHEYHKGWVAGGMLAIGDRIGTANGWVVVEAMVDTGSYEPVINFRVQDFHTYFVGGADWGWALWAHNDYRQVANVLKNAPDVQNAPDAVLLTIAGQLPQGQRAQQMSLALFQGLLETKLINKGLLASGKHLSVETAQAVKAVAEIHGNTGQTPTITINPATPNPYTAGTIASNQWTAIQALNTSYPTVNALRLRLQLPGGVYSTRNSGLPYQLARTQYYAAQGVLVDVEHPIQSPAGNGEVDLLLTNNRLVDAKAWSPAFWADASVKKRIGIVDSLESQVKKYLNDPTGYSLLLEFKYTIPPDILDMLKGLASDPMYQNRLTWGANVN